MASPSWLGQLLAAVRDRSTSRVLARLSPKDPTASGCAQQLSREADFKAFAQSKFKTGGLPLPDKWGTEALVHYQAALKALRECFDKAGDDPWLDAVVLDAVRHLVATARLARRSAPGDLATGALKSVGTELRSMRAVAYRHDKVHVLLALTVQLYKLYFSMGAIFLMKDLQGQLKGREGELKLCPKGDVCAFNFFCGMLQVLDEHWSGAEASLEQAFADCDKQHAKNCGTILSYLVPVRILRGQVPSEDMLQKYHLQYFAPVVEAFKLGDPVQLESALDAERVRFMRRGIYLAMEKLHVLCLRNLLRRIHMCQMENGGHESQVKLAAVTDVCVSLGMSTDVDEIECMVANLINKKLVKGYIALPQQILVVQKGGTAKAFPPLVEASWS